MLISIKKISIVIFIISSAVLFNIGYRFGSYFSARSTMEILEGDIIDVNNRCFDKLDSLVRWKDTLMVQGCFKHKPDKKR